MAALHGNVEGVQFTFPAARSPQENERRLKDVVAGKKPAGMGGNNGLAVAGKKGGSTAVPSKAAAANRQIVFPAKLTMGDDTRVVQVRAGWWWCRVPRVFGVLCGGVSLCRKHGWPQPCVQRMKQQATPRLCSVHLSVRSQRLFVCPPAALPACLSPAAGAGRDLH